MNVIKRFKLNKKTVFNNKGLTTLEAVITTLIMLTVIVALVDLTNIMKKQNAVSTTTTYISRIIGQQGGVRTSKPSYYPDKYVSSGSLYNDVKKIMNNAGIKDSEWTLTIKTPRDGTVAFKPNTELTLIDKGGVMEVNLTVKYKWKLASQMTPLKLEGDISSVRSSTSNFKIRNSSSAGSQIK